MYECQERDRNDPHAGYVKKIFILAKMDHYVEGLIHIISTLKTNSVVACVEPGNDCFEKYTQLLPDVVLIHHLSIPYPMQAFFERFKVQYNNVKILVFGHRMDNTFLFDVIRSGAHGYVTESMTGGQLLSAIETVCADQLWAERRILSEFVRDSVELQVRIKEIIKGKIMGLGDRLTSREVDVFRFILNGFSTKEISDELALSQQSVKVYLGRIFKKFKVNNRAQLLLAAFEEISPVCDLIQLFRTVLDKRIVDKSKHHTVHRHPHDSDE